MTLKTALLDLGILFLLYACQTKTSPSPQVVQEEAPKDPALVNNSLVFEHQLYRAKPGSFGSYENGFASRNTFELEEGGVKKTAQLTLILQNSNPAAGDYSLGGFTYYMGQDIYPGKGKILMHLDIDGNIYYSEKSDSLNVHISHHGDSVEVEFKAIPLRRHPNNFKVSGKLKIATKPVKPIFKGNAQFTDGMADTLLYTIEKGIHTYRFQKQRSNVLSSNILMLTLKEPLQETKIYKVTHDTPSNGEVGIIISPTYGGLYWPSPLSNTNGKLYVNKEANGDITFTFKDIPSPGLEKDFHGSGVIQTFIP